MGIDVTVLDFLLEFKGRDLGDTLWLGRQGMHIAQDDRIAPAVLERRGVSLPFAELRGETGYAEKLFEFLGSRTITAADNSAYEGATVIHDLNQPAPENLHSKYDCIFDGGTIEHVFSVPTAFDNVMKMLRPGGLFLSVNGANNWLGHGFYQFSPELMWRVFDEQSGFRIISMKLGSLDGMPVLVDALDPAEKGGRYEIGYTPRATYMMVAAEKIKEGGSSRAYQSDYVDAWSRN